MLLGGAAPVSSAGLSSAVEQCLGLRPNAGLPSAIERRYGLRPNQPLPSAVEQDIRRRCRYGYRNNRYGRHGGFDRYGHYGRHHYYDHGPRRLRYRPSFRYEYY
jgi:hypothetical protein